MPKFALAAIALLALSDGAEFPVALCETRTELRLPTGFCATVFAAGVGPARHLTITSSGDVFVALFVSRQSEPKGTIVALRDTNHDGKADVEAAFGHRGADDIEWNDGRLFVSTTTSIERYELPAGELVPRSPPATVVEFDRFEQPEHNSKPFALAGQSIFVHAAAPSNSCQEMNRIAGSRGLSPCPFLARAASVWRLDAMGARQSPSLATRVVSGLRHTMGISVEPRTQRVFAVVHGRDLLHRNWPSLYSPAQGAELPSDELVELDQDANFGWPYCYHDPFQHRRVLSPEYGGDGIVAATCEQYSRPAVVFPAHSAPNDLLFYRGTSFPTPYRDGAFVAFHGGWGRAPFDQRGFSVIFVPFDKHGSPSGGFLQFADGFSSVPVDEPWQSEFRPTGLAEGPDGSLYVSDSRKGRIWKISRAQ